MGLLRVEDIGKTFFEKPFAELFVARPKLGTKLPREGEEGRVVGVDVQKDGFGLFQKAFVEEVFADEPDLFGDEPFELVQFL